MRSGIIAAGILVVFIALAGCTGNQASSSYSVDSKGILSVSCAPVTTSEEILFTNETYTKTKIVMHTQSGDVVTYLAAPEHPKSSDCLCYPELVKNLQDMKSGWYGTLPRVMRSCLSISAAMAGRHPATRLIPSRTFPSLKKATGRSIT